ncbi:hypothetical protein QPB21_004023 [Vibrio alginolyticus]|uniref:hypothetical protein n=1 Tax=unclassified Vibrio TaxID=2614977 RepID=UPI002806958A|nr:MULTISPECIES: hypothetical protein [unclassified Vibrio]EII5415913.1 hypothetical protein [Vibrio alginolyticus]EJL6727509.1 hypothetical protein [Vibrio alginolyticus]EJL6857516.1 hypothetical protein [Vibrio alginolyticus]EJX2556838.1 hypothetical protein [Vibrio alginolyticus]ELA7570935.1 hypothetical protein [Vibrio alginolyticus]
MTKKSLFFLGFFALLFFLSWLLFSNANTSKENELVVHKCSKNDTLTTTLKFFVERSIDMSEDEILLQISELVATSNQVLQRSCIPIERLLTSVTFVDNAFTPHSAKEFSLLYDRLINNLSDQEKQEHLGSLTDFIVVVVKTLPSEYKGYTYPGDVARMAAITLNGNQYVLEHELGHLAMAGHEKGGLQWFQSAQSQAHAYHCGPYRTVMNENLKDGFVIGLYSNPDISIGGQQCGVQNEANNSEVLRQWVTFTQEKQKLLEKVRG